MEKNDDDVMDFLDSAYDGFPLMDFFDGKLDSAKNGFPLMDFFDGKNDGAKMDFL